MPEEPEIDTDKTLTPGGDAWILTSMPIDVDERGFTPLIAALAVPHRAKHAYWHLILSGAAALPAVRRGLTHSNADVRMYCARALDRLVDETAYPALIAALSDGDPRVREEALHALACDRCKDNACRPEKTDVLPKGMELLRTDTDRRVRAFAAEVVGRWVHTDTDAAAALVEASRSDPDPTVRKKAAWYAPGGTIHRKTRPKTPAAESRMVRPSR